MGLNLTKSKNNKDFFNKWALELFVVGSFPYDALNLYILHVLGLSHILYTIVVVIGVKC